MSEGKKWVCKECGSDDVVVEYVYWGNPNNTTPEDIGQGVGMNLDGTAICNDCDAETFLDEVDDD